MDFAYRNVTLNMKQLVEVLRCDLQVTINEELMETHTAEIQEDKDIDDDGIKTYRP